MDQLHSIFGEVARSVPDGPPGEPDFVFRAESLPVPPPVFSSDRIFIRKINHDYNSWYRADRLMIFLESHVSRELAIFLLACVFHEPERTVLELPQTRSDIRRIIYRSVKHEPDDPPVGLSLRPVTFRYFPSVTEKHPWLKESEAHNLPLLALSDADGLAYTDAEWQGRDTVFIESLYSGTVRLAELLLNAGCSWNDVREYELEGDAGFRGVAPTSAELHIILPGSVPWVSHPYPEAVQESDR
jgi:hypothetical protein